MRGQKWMIGQHDDRFYHRRRWERSERSETTSASRIEYCAMRRSLIVTSIWLRQEEQRAPWQQRSSRKSCLEDLRLRRERTRPLRRFQWLSLLARLALLSHHRLSLRHGYSCKRGAHQVPGVAEPLSRQGRRCDRRTA